jgi:hypothetical protein
MIHHLLRYMLYLLHITRFHLPAGNRYSVIFPSGYDMYEAMGLSLRDASKLSGVSHTHIRDMQDRRSTPSFEMVVKYLKAYMVDINAEYVMPKEIFRIIIMKVARRGK